MTPRTPTSITLRLYRALANAFPYEFRNAYEDELLQVTEDSIEPIWRHHGFPGLLRLLMDIAWRIPAEYAAELRADIRYGLRMLRASPGFTAVALISLTLGIGVATAAYSELNGYVLRDVPAVRNADELVTMRGPVSFPDYQRYAERTDLFSSTMAYRAPVPFGISLDGHTERVWGHLVTPSYFTTLGVSPALGRFLSAADGRTGNAPVAIVSYRFWRNHLGSTAAAIGKTLLVNGTPCFLIGVAPEDFQGASPMIYNADIWLPLSVGAALAPELADILQRRDPAVFQMVGRLRPGVTIARVQGALEAMKRQLDEEFQDPNRDVPGRRVVVTPGGKLVPMEKKDLPMFSTFFIALGGLILLIAASNVANMMLARAVERRKEIAVRLALGAGRARLVRQLLTESMLIAAASGVLGFGAACWLMHAASSEGTLPYPMPITIRVEPDFGVLLFTLALTGCACLAFGLIPALQATRPDLTAALKEGGNLNVRRFRRLSMRNLLMVGQMAAALTLLLITGFMVVGHRKIASVETGFDSRNLYLMSLDPLRNGYPAARTGEFLEKALDRIRRLPSVTAAAVSSDTPMAMMGKPGVPFSFDGIRGKQLHGATQFAVGRDYFDTLGVPIVLGRGFRKEDEADGATAVIVSERLAKECWPGRDPLGRRIEIGAEGLPTFGFGGSGRRNRRLAGKTRVFEVVGVVRNLRIGVTAAIADAPSIAYRPLQPADMSQPPVMGWTLMLRSIPGVDVLTQARREIYALDDRITPFNGRSMSDQIDRIAFPVQIALWTYGFIGIFGLILASVGLAGVTAYSVTQRRREIGIRIALGAQRSDVLHLVMKEGAVLILIGAAIGIAGAGGGIRLLGWMLATVAQTAGTSMNDPALLVGAPLLLAAVALVACYLPARRSLRIDPAVSLRQE